jgi:hypothetical protein
MSLAVNVDVNKDFVSSSMDIAVAGGNLLLANAI